MKKLFIDAFQVFMLFFGFELIAIGIKYSNFYVAFIGCFTAALLLELRYGGHDVR